MRKFFAVSLIVIGIFMLGDFVLSFIVFPTGDFNIGILLIQLLLISLLGISSIVCGRALYTDKDWAYIGSLIVTLVVPIYIVNYFHYSDSQYSYFDTISAYQAWPQFITLLTISLILLIISIILYVRKRLQTDSNIDLISK